MRQLTVWTLAPSLRELAPNGGRFSCGAEVRPSTTLNDSAAWPRGGLPGWEFLPWSAVSYKRWLGSAAKEPRRHSFGLRCERKTATKITAATTPMIHPRTPEPMRSSPRSVVVGDFLTCTQPVQPLPPATDKLLPRCGRREDIGRTLPDYAEKLAGSQVARPRATSAPPPIRPAIPPHPPSEHDDPLDTLVGPPHPPGQPRVRLGGPGS